MSGEKEEARATLQRHQQVSELGHGRPRGLQPCKGRQKTPRSSGHVCTPSETGEVTRFGGRVGATGLNGRRCRSGPTLCGLEPGDHGGMRPAYPSLSPSQPPTHPSRVTRNGCTGHSLAEASVLQGQTKGFVVLSSSWQTDGETVETVADFIFGGSKITADSDCSHEIKRRLLLGRKVMTNQRQHIKKQRHYFANKGLSSQGYGVSSSHVWM